MTYYSSPNRYVCSVLDEMREQLKNLNHFTLRRFKNVHAMMIEEVQTHVNHMETGLHDWQDLQSMRKEKRKLKKQIKELQAKKDEITPEKEDE